MLPNSSWKHFIQRVAVPRHIPNCDHGILLKSGWIVWCTWRTWPDLPSKFWNIGILHRNRSNKWQDPNQCQLRTCSALHCQCTTCNSKKGRTYVETSASQCRRRWRSDQSSFSCWHLPLNWAVPFLFPTKSSYHMTPGYLCSGYPLLFLFRPTKLSIQYILVYSIPVIPDTSCD